MPGASTWYEYNDHVINIIYRDLSSSLFLYIYVHRVSRSIPTRAHGKVERIEVNEKVSQSLARLFTFIIR